MKTARVIHFEDTAEIQKCLLRYVEINLMILYCKQHMEVNKVAR